MDTSNIKSLLLVISISVTLSVILLIRVGWGVSAEYTVVTIIALVGWLTRSYRSVPRIDSLLPVYIVCIALLIALNTFRYMSSYANFIAVHYSNRFAHDLVMSHTNWFVWMVGLPIVILLLGGYFLSKGYRVGACFAWWGYAYVAVESIIQLLVELGNYSLYTHHYFGGVWVAMLLFYLGGTGILKLMRPQDQGITQEPIQLLSRRKKNLWTILIVTCIAIYGMTFYAQTGSLLPVGVIIGSMMGGLVCWRKTTSYVPADPYTVVPLYLLLQALFYIHVGEEVLTHFNQGIASITGQTWTDRDFDYLITLIGPFFWILGAYSLWKRQAFGNFILWFMIVGMILGEPTHLLVFPIVRMVQEGVGYEYFSGMYTALFPMIPAILSLILIVKDYRKHKETMSHD